MQTQENEYWTAYWNQEKAWTYPELFKVNADLFFKKAQPYLKFKAEDRILDIGCGPGFLEALLAERVKSVVAIDSSAALIEECAKQTAAYANVLTHVMKENYLDLKSYGEGFSLFLCVSVAQYFKSIAEVEALILSAQAIACPGAKMIIADMPRNRGLLGQWWDHFCSLILSMREGYGLLLLRKVFTNWRKMTAYRNYASKLGHLYLTESDFLGIAKRLDLNAEILREDFSICANRLNFLIHF